MTAVDRLQQALAGEHAAVYGFEVLAAQASGSLRTRLSRALDEHRAARDALTARINAQGAVPVSAERGYVVPGRGSDQADDVEDSAALMEQRLGVLYAQAIEDPDPQVRRVGLAGLRATTIRATSWTGIVQDLPGLQQPSVG
jgi:sirohydrochlorin ferrochelatase